MSTMFYCPTLYLTTYGQMRRLYDIAINSHMELYINCEICLSYEIAKWVKNNTFVFLI